MKTGSLQEKVRRFCPFYETGVSTGYMILLKPVIPGHKLTKSKVMWIQTYLMATIMLLSKNQDMLLG